MSEIVAEPVVVVADKVAEGVAVNAESISTISRVMSDLFDIVAANGKSIQALKSFSNALAEFSTATFRSVISATQRVMAIATENANNIAYLENAVGKIAERVDTLEPFILIGFGLGVFNTVFILTVVIALLWPRKKK